MTDATQDLVTFSEIASLSNIPRARFCYAARRLAMKPTAVDGNTGLYTHAQIERLLIRISRSSARDERRRETPALCDAAILALASRREARALIETADSFATPRRTDPEPPPPAKKKRKRVTDPLTEFEVSLLAVIARYAGGTDPGVLLIELELPAHEEARVQDELRSLLARGYLRCSDEFYRIKVKGRTALAAARGEEVRS